ncbi:MAG: sugar kinase [Rhizobiales bacterium]|nr:sugar kinase [Hyphomicrobiales bacterium]
MRADGRRRSGIRARHVRPRRRGYEDKDDDCAARRAAVLLRAGAGQGAIVSGAAPLAAGGDRRPVLSVGALTCDLMFNVAALPHGPGKFLAGGATMVAAGMATSAAIAVARLGRPVALWASAGDDGLGDFLVGALAREGIDPAHVRRVPATMSATASIIVAADGERIVVPYYAPALMDAPAAVPPIADGAFAAVLADVRWPAAAALALDAARSAGVPGILDLDVGRAEILADLAPRASHIAASLAGAAILTGADSLDAAAAGLHERFGATIIVTGGEAGLAFVQDGAVRRMPAFAVEAVDTNAAGDVFHGAFAVALADGLALEAALTFASAAAAIKCTRHGGPRGAPARAEVLAFLQERET